MWLRPAILGLPTFITSPRLMETPAEVTVHFERPSMERLEQLARLSGKTVAEVVETYIKVQMGWRPETGAETAAVSPAPADSVYNPVRPANLTPEEAAEWDYYTSPEAQALYARFPPMSAEVAALRGSLKLRPEDARKSYDELRYEALRDKYGL